MIEIKNLHKSFAGNRVLKNINFTIEKSQVVAIIGPSGTGKSTFLRCINYLEKPDNGIIKFDDEIYNFSNISRDEIYKLRKKSSMVFQNYALFKNMTVLENVTLHLQEVKHISKKDAEEIAKYYLNKVKLIDKLDEFPSRISGGQQQRVGIARAMAIQPEVMLLDEPTSSLDPELVKGILDLINDLANENQTMIIVTHEIKFAREVADLIVFMYDGQILEYGNSNDIYNNPKSKELKNFLGNIL